MPNQWAHTVVGSSISKGTAFESAFMVDGLDTLSTEGLRHNKYHIENVEYTLHTPEHAVPVDGTVPSDSPEKSRVLEYMSLSPGQKMSELSIDTAFIGSCTNSRLSDLRRAAMILRDRHVAPGVKAICVPGSNSVKRAAEREGLDRIFIDAGFEWQEPGCAMCFFAGGASFGDRDRVISSTNRNFEGRQGPGARTHIASPETVAWSAIQGRIADVRTSPAGDVHRAREAS